MAWPSRTVTIKKLVRNWEGKEMEFKFKRRKGKKIRVNLCAIYIYIYTMDSTTLCRWKKILSGLLRGRGNHSENRFSHSVSIESTVDSARMDWRAPNGRSLYIFRPRDDSSPSSIERRIGFQFRLALCFLGPSSIG